MSDGVAAGQRAPGHAGPEAGSAVELGGEWEPSRVLVLVGLVFAFLLLELPFLTEAYHITVDEPWYSQTGHSFAMGRGIHNDVIGSGGGDMFFLYAVFLGVPFKIFGTTFYVGRFVSVFFGVVSIAGIVCVLYRMGLRWREVSLCTLAVIVSNLSYLTFRAIRPEAAITAFTVCSTFFLLDALRSKSSRSAAIAGLLAAVGLMCHPNMVVIIAVAGLLLGIDAIRHRAFGPVLVYGATAALGGIAVLVFLHFVFVEGLAPTISRMLTRTGASALGGGDGPGLLGASIANAQDFFGRAIVGGRRGLIVAAEMGVLVWGVVSCKRLASNVLLPLLAAGFLALGFVVLQPFSLRSFTAVEWMIFATFGLLISDLQRRGGGWRMWAAQGLLALIVVNNLAGDLYLIRRDYGAVRYSELAERISEVVPSGSVVLSHQLLWFPLQDSTVYNEYSRSRLLEPDSLDALIESGDVDYVVLASEETFATMMGGALGDNTLGEGFIRYWNSVRAHAEVHGERVETIEAKGYGDFTIWRTGRAPP
ncbi:MAG: glycosyltransferase family 39 protein [Proteobacteria bacterium]|nr:glycosyltransferase family 39 protein [Pseudomonadota bacterium]